MEETAVKEIDSQGRISIPAHWRRGWRTRKLILVRHEDRIEILPIESTPPSELFDTIKIAGSVDFTDPHSLKKALTELREA
ncbi:AbrB family transcriptional regulator [Candidatus Bathyarchaeota archaeon]|nr:AbrB family transcriptional regulator [Candidatus Bathyarchaeota archaeon]